LSSFAMKKERGGVMFYGWVFRGGAWWVTTGKRESGGEEKKKNKKEMITRDRGFNLFVVAC